jgi:hypothetical protein
VLILSQPLPDTVCNPGDASFTIHTQNVLTYQWQLNTDNGWDDIHDNFPYTGTATSILHVLNASTAMNEYHYRCYVADSCCNAYSSPASLYVFSSVTPSLNINANATSFCDRDTAIFRATVNDSSILPHYQWMTNMTNAGADTDVYVDNDLHNADVVKCILNTDHVCATTHTVVSNSIVVNVLNVRRTSIFLQQTSIFLQHSHQTEMVKMIILNP